jgi:hypothetical protein
LTNIEPEFVLMIQITSNLVCLAPSEQDSVVTVVSNANNLECYNPIARQLDRLMLSLPLLDN